MPSPRERRRNNVRVGIFVTVSLALALAVVFILSDAWETWFRPTHHYAVTFPLSPGVKNLKDGADVRVGGLSMGKVKKVRPVMEDGAYSEIIEVEFTLDKRARLFSNAEVAVAAALIGSDAWLEVSDLGGTTDESGQPIAGVTALAPGDVIAGYTPEGLLASVLGARGADDTKRIMKNVAEFSDFLADIDSKYASDIKPVIGDVGELVHDVRADYAEWTVVIDDVLTRANNAATRLESLMASADEGVGDVRAVVNDNRASIDEIISNLNASGADIREITERLAGETMDKFDQLMTRGQDGVDAFARTLEKLEPEVDVWTTDVRDSLANARLASQQLKLALIEVRRSPWKVLYRPSATELEHELLYESARAFVVAASDLKASSEALQRVLDEHGERIDEEQPTLRRLYDGLAESFERYERAQQRLFDVLVTDE